MVEARMRELGTPLPTGVTGAQLYQIILPELRRAFFAKGGRDGQFADVSLGPIPSIMQQLASELPGGRAHPDFAALFLTRVKEWVASKFRIDPV